MIKTNSFRRNDDHKTKTQLKYIPVVDSKDNMTLLYQIKVSELKEKCEMYYGPLDDAYKFN